MNEAERKDVEHWRNTVGRRVEQRRSELFRSRRQAAEASLISESAWRNFEMGSRQVAPGVTLRVRPSMVHRVEICRVLGWRTDSIERILAGGDPEPAFDRSEVSGLQGRSLTGLTEAEWAVLEATLTALRRSHE